MNKTIPHWASRDIEDWARNALNLTHDDEVEGFADNYRLIVSSDPHGWCVVEAIEVDAVLMIRRVEGIVIIKEYSENGCTTWVGTMKECHSHYHSR